MESLSNNPNNIGYFCSGINGRIIYTYHIQSLCCISIDRRIICSICLRRLYTSMVDICDRRCITYIRILV